MLPIWRIARQIVPSVALSALALGSMGGSAAATTRAAATASSGNSGGFFLERLPKGKDVTLPRPATTFVTLASQIVLTATDIPQTLSFRPVNVTHGALQAIRLAIYDRTSERVQYVDLTPGTPFLYNFKELSSITVIPQAKGAAAGGLSLQVESDKPLEITH